MRPLLQRMYIVDYKVGYKNMYVVDYEQVNNWYRSTIKYICWYCHNAGNIGVARSFAAGCTPFWFQILTTFLVASLLAI